MSKTQEKIALTLILFVVAAVSVSLGFFLAFTMPAWAGKIVFSIAGVYLLWRFASHLVDTKAD